MRVEDVMTRAIFTCDTRANLENIAQVMWEHDCGCVPIVNGCGIVMGMVTDRDLAMAAYIQGKRLADIPVQAVMSQHVHACEAGISIELAQRIMRSAHIRRLPVIDSKGKLIGLVTLSDILATVQRESASDAEALNAEVINTLDAVSTHHR